MPIVPTSYTNPTGKNNLLSSINKWLEVNIPTAGATDFKYFFTAQVASAMFPRVEVTEFPFFDPHMSAFGNVLFNAAPYTSDQGTENNIMLDFNIYDAVSDSVSAKKHVMQIRDRLIKGLKQAGMADDVTGVELVPPIKVLDYDNAAADTGIVARVLVNEDNAIIERYYAPTAETPDVHRYQLLVRVQWFEMF